MTARQAGGEVRRGYVVVFGRRRRAVDPGGGVMVAASTARGAVEGEGTGCDDEGRGRQAGSDVGVRPDPVLDRGGWGARGGVGFHPRSRSDREGEREWRCGEGVGASGLGFRSPRGYGEWGGRLGRLGGLLGRSPVRGGPFVFVCFIFYLFIYFIFCFKSF